VTGVSSTGDIELVRSLGADHVPDHTRKDFTRSICSSATARAKVVVTI